jgi:hypothetical protein
MYSSGKLGPSSRRYSEGNSGSFFTNGKGPVLDMLTGRHVYVDSSLNRVFEGEFAKAEPFFEERAVVGGWEDGRDGCALINMSGEVVVEFGAYDNIGPPRTIAFS